MFAHHHVFPLVVALVLAGAGPGTGQTTFSAPAEAPKPPVAPKPAEPPKLPVMPGQNPAATGGQAKPAAPTSSTLQTKTAPRTPPASGLGSSSSSQLAAKASAAGLPATSTSAPAENSIKIVRVYHGPGRFDEKLAGQLKVALQKAFGTEPDSQNPAGTGPGSPAGSETGQPKIAQNNAK